MAEGLLRERLMASGKNVRVASAGLQALAGHPVDATATTLMAERGIDVSGHRARQLTADLARQHDLILVMEDWQVRAVEKIWPGARGRVHTLGRWQGFEVADPYRKPRADFEFALRLIDAGINDWMQRL